MQPKYKRIPPPVKNPVADAPIGSGTMLGLTLWRIRDATPADKPGTRLLVLGKKKGECTQERVDVAEPITPEHGYRFTFEMPASGYLYVIDRERYANGKLSEPYLIYPNNAGDNVLVPGRLLEIPDRREDPNYFSIEAKPGQLGEVITFLVTPEPIPGLKFSHDPVLFDPALFASLEKKAAASPDRYEMEGGTGTTISVQENKAGADHSTTVTQSDPLPQTLYRVAAKPGTPVMIEIPLNFK